METKAAPAPWLWRRRVTAERALPMRGVWVLVDNAVSTEDKPIEDVDDADLDRVIRSGDR